MKDSIFLKLFLTFGLGTAIIGGFIIAPFGAFAHSPKVHAPLMGASAELYNEFYPNNKLNSRESEWIAQGAYDEDSPSIRAMHHFYDPISGKGLPGYTSSKVWARDGAAQYGIGGDHSWEEGLAAYERGDKEKAYKALGHVIHLVQDASVPAHTRNDPHPHGDILYGGADPFEQAAKDTSNFKIPSTAGLSPVIYGDLGTYFDKVALYTNTHFYSKDSVGHYEKPIPVKYDNDYVYGRDDKGKYRLLKFFRPETRFFNKENIELYQDAFDDPLVLQDYWNRLAPVAIENGAGIIKLFHETAREPVPSKVSAEEGFLSKTKNWFARLGRSVNSGLMWIKEFGTFAGSSIQISEKTVSGGYSSVFATSPLAGKEVDVSIDLASKEENEQASGEFYKQLQGAEFLSAFTDELTVVEEESAEIVPDEDEDENISNEEVSQNDTEEQSSEEAAPEELYLVSRVIDGDTVVLENDEKVRLIGINAPELPNGCFSQEATDKLKELIENKQVRLEEGPSDKDDYDRLLRYIWLEDTHINAALVETGHAYAYDFGDTHAYGDDFKTLHEDARKDRLGLWGSACRSFSSTSKKSSSGSTSQQDNKRNEAEDKEEVENEEEEDKEEEEKEEGEEEEFRDLTGKEVVINEIAWMGTRAGHTHQWIELYNNTDQEIDLANWQLISQDGSPNITIGEDEDSKTIASSTISANGYYILEWRSSARSEEPVISTIKADWHGSFGRGGLKNAGEDLFLRDPASTTIDEVKASDKWFGAGNNSTKQTMERVDPMGYGSDPENWASNNIITRNGEDAKENPINGTPGSKNSVSFESTNIRRTPFWRLFQEFDEITFTKLGSPYTEAFGINVPSGKTLIVEPGVAIETRSGSSINGGVWRIRGTVLAIGTEEEKIIFRGRGGVLWCGMHFLSPSEGSVFENVVVKNSSFGGGCTRGPVRHRSIFVEGGLTIIDSEIIGGNIHNKVSLRSAKHIDIDGLVVRYMRDKDSGRPVTGSASHKRLCDIKIILVNGEEVIHTPPCDEEELPEEPVDKVEGDNEEEAEKDDEHDCEVPYVCEEDEDSGENGDNDDDDNDNDDNLDEKEDEEGDNDV